LAANQFIKPKCGTQALFGWFWGLSFFTDAFCDSAHSVSRGISKSTCISCMMYEFVQVVNEIIRLDGFLFREMIPSANFGTQTSTIILPPGLLADAFRLWVTSNQYA